jgi:hypothetical protein
MTAEIIPFPTGDYSARKLGQFFASNPKQSFCRTWPDMYCDDLEAMAGIEPNQCNDRYISQLLAVTRRELSDERKARIEAERLLRIKEREAK